MFTIGFLNKQNKHNMSFNQDINFHRTSKHLRLQHASPQRMLSCPNPGGTGHRFKSAKTGSNVSLNSACSSKDECSSGDNSDHNQGEPAPFIRDPSLQSSFNSDRSSNLSSVENFSTQGGSESPVLPVGPPFTQSLPAFPTTQSAEADYNNHIDSLELTEFSEKHFAYKKSHLKKKKTKKSSKSSSSSSVASDGSNSLTVIPNGSGLDSSRDSGSWYQFMMPSYKSRLSTYHTTFMNIPTTEKLVDDFMCALHRDILLQGRLYLSVNYIAFYSNILGFETKVAVHFSDIKHITKATTIKLFHNAIEVYTFSGDKFFFTSFVSRDRAYREMKTLWDSANSNGGVSKIEWSEVCRMIRQSYSTQNLGANLSDLEEADLEKHLSNAKTVRKRLLKKKDKMQSMTNSSHITINSARLVNGSSDLEEEEDQYEDTVDEFDDEVDGGHFETKRTWADRIRYCVRLATVPISRMCHGIKAGLSDVGILVRVCCLLAFLLLLFQVGIFVWIISFDDRLGVYRDLIAQALERQIQLQPLQPTADQSVTNSVMSQVTSSSA